MYLRRLEISNTKLLRKFALDFVNADGTPRMWTVIIGENGTCKTSVLRAIAMGAAGGQHIGRLVDMPAQYCDKRHSEAVKITAEFSVDARLSAFREYPGFLTESKPQVDVRVIGEVSINADGTGLSATSSYVPSAAIALPRGLDPIRDVRADDRSLWFVAGYGPQRMLRLNADEVPSLDRPSIDRLRPLFGREELAGPSLANLFSPEGVRKYSSALQSVLFSTQKLLPGFTNLELRGKGGVRTATDLQTSHRFVQEFSSASLKLPATWLSHGYQSTIAWIADLVGQIVLEADMDMSLPASEMEGLVLIDEIDLYLHPAWQRVLIGALRDAFPRIQFVATTHSPLSLMGLRTDLDEIVLLRCDPATGDVDKVDLKQGREHEPDPRLMTGTEIYRTYFGIGELYPAAIGQQLRRYRYLAADPTRSENAERDLDTLEEELRENGVDVRFPRVPRESV